MFNKAFIIGRLGQDPETRYTQDGTAVTNLNVATSEVFKDSEGQRKEKTEWHRVVAWGKQAENCGQYLAKGRLVQVEGKLQTRKFEDKEGVTRYVTEIKAGNVIFLPSNNGNGSAPDAGGGGDDTDDDIPF